MHVFCQQCGAQVTQTPYGHVQHECRFEQLLEFQTQCARLELENGLEAQVVLWEHEPKVANRLAFARYVRERAEASARRTAA